MCWIVVAVGCLAVASHVRQAESILIDALGNRCDMRDALSSAHVLGRADPSKIPAVDDRSFGPLRALSNLFLADDYLAALVTLGTARRGILAGTLGTACAALPKVVAATAPITVKSDAVEIDEDYPGTAVERLRNVQQRVKSLHREDLSEDWAAVRKKLLWAGGLRDLPDNIPGKGYTGHSFNDYNHCDLCTMRGDVAENLNEGNIPGIARGNRLGPGIVIASLPELGPGGSWSTCQIGCNQLPPKDVAHVQFRSRVAFKLVWCPPYFDSFVLVDDEGNLLNRGTPTGALPDVDSRRANYMLTRGSKYAKEATISGRLSTYWVGEDDRPAIQCSRKQKGIAYDTGLNCESNS